MANRFYSRLEEKEEARTKRKTVIFGFLTLILLAVIIFSGIPLLVKLASLLGDLRSKSIPQTEEKKYFLPPPPPRLLSAFNATNSAEIEINGLSERDSIVDVYLNDRLDNTVAVNSEGDFKSEISFPQEGEYTISAVAKNNEGNTSEKSGALTVVYDKTPPPLELSAPENGSVSENQTIEIVGKTEEMAKVLVNDSTVIIESDGSFKSRQILKEGRNSFNIIAKDRAGNTTSQELSMTYVP